MLSCSAAATLERVRAPIRLNGAKLELARKAAVVASVDGRAEEGAEDGKVKFSGESESAGPFIN